MLLTSLEWAFGKGIFGHSWALYTVLRSSTWSTNIFWRCRDLLMRHGNVACLLSLNELCCNGNWWVMSHSYFTSWALSLTLSCPVEVEEQFSGWGDSWQLVMVDPLHNSLCVLDKLNSVCISLPHTSRVPVSQTSHWLHMVFFRDYHVATARQKYSIWCCYRTYKKALMNSDFIPPHKKYGNVMPDTFCCSQPLLQSVLLCLFLSRSALGGCAHL